MAHSKRISSLVPADHHHHPSSATPTPPLSSHIRMAITKRCNWTLLGLTFVSGWSFRREEYVLLGPVLDRRLESELFAIANDRCRTSWTSSSTLIPTRHVAATNDHCDPQMHSAPRHGVFSCPPYACLLFFSISVRPPAELPWRAANRTVRVRKTFTNVTHPIARDSVTNTAPRRSPSRIAGYASTTLHALAQFVTSISYNLEPHPASFDPAAS
ncbi:hypothetical protein DFH09DRAFT_1376139 [Mycena vulgaris]|nr:hypothetical protein DFH09DRAFT_1376139 [Mycena vulgaris]